MPVIQSTDTCWLASWEGDTRTDQEAAAQGIHYVKRERIPSGSQPFHKKCGGLVYKGGYCTLCEESGVRGRRLVERKVVIPRPLLGCWAVFCDVCEDELEDADTVGGLHFGSFDRAARCAISDGWRVYSDGRAVCPLDAAGSSGEGLYQPAVPDHPVLFSEPEVAGA